LAFPLSGTVRSFPAGAAILPLPYYIHGEEEGKRRSAGFLGLRFHGLARPCRARPIRAAFVFPG
jgi:hypothetical protein